MLPAYTRLSQGGDIKLRLTRKMITSSEVSFGLVVKDVRDLAEENVTIWCFVESIQFVGCHSLISVRSVLIAR